VLFTKFVITDKMSDQVPEVLPEVQSQRGARGGRQSRGRGRGRGQGPNREERRRFQFNDKQQKDLSEQLASNLRLSLFIGIELNSSHPVIRLPVSAVGLILLFIEYWQRAGQIGNSALRNFTNNPNNTFAVMRALLTIFHIRVLVCDRESANPTPLRMPYTDPNIKMVRDYARRLPKTFQIYFSQIGCLMNDLQPITPELARTALAAPWGANIAAFTHVAIRNQLVGWPGAGIQYAPPNNIYLDALGALPGFTYVGGPPVAGAFLAPTGATVALWGAGQNVNRNDFTILRTFVEVLEQHKAITVVEWDLHDIQGNLSQLVRFRIEPDENDTTVQGTSALKLPDTAKHLAGATLLGYDVHAAIRCFYQVGSPNCQERTDLPYIIQREALIREGI
jgi:hypothetical protein